MALILVTGGTGTLGRPTVARLSAAGHEVRVLSRRETPTTVRGNLLSGHGVDDAVHGVDLIVHLATGRRDDDATRLLIARAEAAAVPHLVLQSIVGVDRIPLPYYRRKLASEGLAERSSIPHTIVRATQFHDLIARLFATQRRLPVLLAPAFALQPIDVTEVASRLVELCAEPPLGRVPDIGGPTALPGPALAQQWQTSAGIRRRIQPLTLPGRTFAAYRAGHGLVSGPAYGRRTFAEFLAVGDHE